jgi:hypothetical protein
VQHWLKVMHRFRGADQAWVGDPHRLGRDGAPVMRPAGVPRISVGPQSRLRLTPEQFEAGRATIEPGA